MPDVTQILNAIEQGYPSAAEHLLPLVYEELRNLAAANMAREAPGQTLQATGLVHEAYIRLVDVDKARHWDSRGHFFAAAAEAMRRILIDQARRKQAKIRGGDRRRFPLSGADPLIDAQPENLLALDDALDRLASEDDDAAAVARLHVFGGLSVDEAADALQISRTSAYRRWTYARAWLRTQFRDDE